MINQFFNQKEFKILQNYTTDKHSWSKKFVTYRLFMIHEACQMIKMVEIVRDTKILFEKFLHLVTATEGLRMYYISKLKNIQNTYIKILIKTIILQGATDQLK